MMLHQRHLGHEIGRGDQFRLGVARGDDGVQVEVIIPERDVEFVEDHEPEGRISHELERLRPGTLRGGDVALEVLRLPGETLAHGVPGHLVGERGKGVALRRMPCAFDELHDADPMAASEHAQREPEGGGGFPFAGAGMDDEETFLGGLAGDLGILHRFALRHLGAMALDLGPIGRFHHGLPLMVSGTPATTRTTRSARAAIRWLSWPCRSRNRRPRALSGTMPKPTSLATSTSGAAAFVNTASRRSISASTSAPSSNAFESHSVKQSTSTGAVPWAASAPTTSRGVSSVRHPAPRRAW